MAKKKEISVEDKLRALRDKAGNAGAFKVSNKYKSNKIHSALSETRKTKPLLRL